MIIVIIIITRPAAAAAACRGRARVYVVAAATATGRVGVASTARDDGRRGLRGNGTRPGGRPRTPPTSVSLAPRRPACTTADTRTPYRRRRRRRRSRLVLVVVVAAPRVRSLTPSCSVVGRRPHVPTADRRIRTNFIIVGASRAHVFPDGHFGFILFTLSPPKNRKVPRRGRKRYNHNDDKTVPGPRHTAEDDRPSVRRHLHAVLPAHVPAAHAGKTLSVLHARSPRPTVGRRAVFGRPARVDDARPRPVLYVCTRVSDLLRFQTDKKQ